MERTSGAVFKLMLLNAAAAVDNDKQPINELNVFPVPDGDTGTNMSLTLLAAAAELRKAPDDITTGEAAEIAARAMVRGARGNSGVILSLLFRGMSKVMKNTSDIDARLFAYACHAGVQSAYRAVMKPAEGTILTVGRVAAEKATAICDNVTVAQLLDMMIEAANKALDETIHQNPVLEKAGVIDAGGKGLCVIFEAMRLGLDGVTVEQHGAEAQQSGATFTDYSSEDIKFVYCTEFIINLAKDELGRSHDRLRAYLDSLGDSLVFVEDEDIIKIHVHTNDPGLAIQASLKLGMLSKMKIDNMREQHTEKVILTGQVPVKPTGREIKAPEKRYGIVAVCAGDGLKEIFHDIGADVVVEGGQTMNPSTEDILRAVDSTPAEVVFVTPNNKNIIMAAEACISMSDKTVIVLPTKTVPQGVSALLMFNPDAEPKQNRDAMVSASRRVRSGQITYAARDSSFDGRKIKEGDYLAILDGEMVANNRSQTAALRRLAKELHRKPAEFITLFYGDSVTEAAAETAQEIMQKEFKDAEVNVVRGGQPVYAYLVSAE